MLTRFVHISLLAVIIGMISASQAHAKIFKYSVDGDGKYEFTIPEASSATIIISGDGEDSEINIDAEAVTGSVRVVFQCDLEDAKIVIVLPDAEKKMSVSFTKNCDVSDASCQIFAQLSEKEQPVTVTNNAHDKEGFELEIVR